MKVQPATPPALTRRGAIVGVAGGLLGGCHSLRIQPSIEFTRIPQADEGGRAKHEIIEGRVTGAHTGQQIVLYAKSGAWWVQPLVTRPFTKIQPDGKWTAATHLGTEYAALLVELGYRPSVSMNILPSAGGDVAAIAVAKGASSPPSPSLRFSGHEWRVRDAPSNRGGPNLYAPSNAWTDVRGALHLRIAKDSGKWTCAEVSLTRSLGYGTYSFIVQDTSRLAPAAVFTMFTWDYAGVDENFHEIDIEISRFGDPASKNAQYVIQPYYVPANVERFSAPSGVLMHSFHWAPGRISFRTVRGSGTNAGSHPVAEHVFTSGVPSPGIESVRMNLYVFASAKIPLENGAEVVIEKFEYLP
ncbi:MAG TPA: glycoside hydrolase family 16 protein [Bryobacteraceae bacterium]|nr:glycoside hydrolase family 16 protein [Bryobacteraceae bacterium]